MFFILVDMISFFYITSDNRKMNSSPGQANKKEKKRKYMNNLPNRVQKCVDLCQGQRRKEIQDPPNKHTTAVSSLKLLSKVGEVPLYYKLHLIMQLTIQFQAPRISFVTI